MVVRVGLMVICLALSLATRSSGAMRDGLDAWRIHASIGNAVTVRAGTASISARLNTHAYLAKPATSDLVTVSARVRPSSPTGVSWCTSLFLVWNERNWCQFGITDLNGGPAFYVTEMVDGGPQEIYLPRTDGKPEQTLQIELGADCIRYLGGSRTAPKVLRVVERPRFHVGAPRMIAVGKGYATGAPPYGSPGLANDYADAGQVVVSEVRDIRVAPTPLQRARMSDAERRAIREELCDHVGATILRMPGDPTFERVARPFPPFRFPREVSGVPGHAMALAIDHIGGLAFAGPGGMRPGRWSLRLDATRPLLRDYERPARRLAHGWMPVVVLSGRVGKTKWEQTAFATSPGFGPNGEMSAYVRFKVTVQQPGATPTSVVLRSEPSGQTVALRLERMPDGSRTAAARITATSGEATAVPMAELERALADYTGAWKREAARGMQITVPEARVTDGWKAWLAYAMLNTKLNKGRWEVHDGSGFYDEVYGYSALLHAMAADLYGRHDLSAKVLGGVFAVQQPDGLYTENYGLPDMGALLMACAERYRLTRDRAWLRRVAPNMIRAANWILARRAGAPKSGPAQGMILFRPYCDHPAPVYGFYGDTYGCVGLQHAADVLGDIGLSAEARRFRAEAARYRADLCANMDASVIVRNGRRLMPMEPATQRLLRDAGYRGGHYWGLVASCMLETEFLSCHGTRARTVVDSIERNGGLICGLSEFAGGVDHAYAYGYLLTKLKQGDVPRVLLGFYSMLAHGMTRDTYSAVECTQILTGDNAGTLPHTYSSTQQLRLLRMMLLREEGNRLHIGQAIPRHWLKAGQSVEVRNAPTRFGLVSLTIRSESARRTTVRLSLPASAPTRVDLHTRHAGGLRPRSARVNGAAGWSVQGERLVLNHPSRSVTATLVF